MSEQTKAEILKQYNEIGTVKERRSKRKGISTIAKNTGTSEWIVRSIVEPHFNERQNELRRKRQKKVESKATLQELPLTLDWGNMFGDPLPGRSALDQRRKLERA